MKWKTASGEKIRIKDMSHSHLNNAIALLERRAEQEYLQCLSYPEPNGEMAIIAYSSAIDALLDGGAESLLPEIYYELTAELDKRKI